MQIPETGITFFPSPDKIILVRKNKRKFSLIEAARVEDKVRAFMSSSKYIGIFDQDFFEDFSILAFINDSDSFEAPEQAETNEPEAE